MERRSPLVLLVLTICVAVFLLATKGKAKK